MTHDWHALFILGAVVLTVTGGEALYADMGHFGKKPIRWAWFGFVLPALVLNYFGQGAVLLEHPAAVANPFFMSMPDWAQIPMTVLATVAAVIASQAVITGAFSVTRQAIQLGYLPRLSIKHTSQGHHRPDLRAFDQLDAAAGGDHRWCWCSAVPPRWPRPTACRSPAPC